MEELSNRPAAEDLYALLVLGEGGIGPFGTGTAIVVAALLAGTQLFRNTGLDLADGMTPGQYVILDMLNEPGIALLNALDEDLAALKGESFDGFDLEPLAGTGPTQSLLDLVQIYEPAYNAIMDRHGISPNDRASTAILSAALVIHRATPVMDAETGKSIVAQALVHACKTVPPPRPS